MCISDVPTNTVSMRHGNVMVITIVWMALTSTPTVVSVIAILFHVSNLLFYISLNAVNYSIKLTHNVNLSSGNARITNASLIHGNVMEMMIVTMVVMRR